MEIEFNLGEMKVLFLSTGDASEKVAEDIGELEFG